MVKLQCINLYTQVTQNMMIYTGLILIFIDLLEVRYYQYDPV